MLPEVGVGEEGDVVPGVPVDGVHDDVKVVRGLVEEVVERADDLKTVLEVNSIAMLKSQQTFQKTFHQSFYSSVGHPVVLETLLKSLLKSLLRFQQSY